MTLITLGCFVCFSLYIYLFYCVDFESNDYYDGFKLTTDVMKRQRQRFAHGNLVRQTVIQETNEKSKFNTQSTGQILYGFTIEFLEAILFLLLR